METARRYTTVLLATAVVALTGPSIAQAQFTSAVSSTHHWLAIGFGGGEIVPTGNATTDYQGSFQGQAYVIINLGILPELRFNLGFQRWNFRQQLLSSMGYPSATSGHNNVLAGIGGTRIDLIRGPVRPYLTLGIGAFNLKSVVDTTVAGSAKTTSVSSQATTKFGLDGGAGLAVHVKRVEVFAEGQIQNVFTNTGFISSAKQIQAVPVSFGITYAIF